MTRGTRTVYPSKRNKGSNSTFQPPEEGRSVQRPKHYDKHGDKDEDNSQKNVNNVHNTSSQKYRQINMCVCVCVCARACVCVCVCVHAWSLRAIITNRAIPAKTAQIFGGACR